ncbi:MAG: ComEC family competence protein, partial [candidate division Zixibacteria bacterium]|nr:ComEC family competence protein [candidate division Zixibacteria bacterium]
LIKIKKPSHKFNYGDKISVRAYLFSPQNRRNPGSFDYKRHLNVKGIYGQMTVSSPDEVFIQSRPGNLLLTKIIYPARQKILEHFNRSLAPPYNYLLAGFLLGEKRGMPQEIYDKFTQTGTLHLMAVSGSNVALVLVFAYFVIGLLPLPRWVKFAILSGVIVFFALLTNLQPSVTRASIMAILALFAYYTEREINFLNLVSVTLLIILFFNPQALFDVGFQLSFSSVLAIGVLFPRMKSMYLHLFTNSPKHLNRFIVFPFFVSTAAILGALPLSVYYFDSFSPVGFVSNLAVVPLVGVSVVVASLSSLFSFVLPPLSQILVSANWLILKMTLAAVKFFGGASFSLVTVPRPPGWVFAFYPAFLFFLFFSGVSKRFRLGLALTIILAVSIGGIEKKLAAARDLSATLTVLDINNVDAVYIELPDGRNLLYLHQLQPVSFDYVDWTILPFLYKRGTGSLDRLILADSNPGADTRRTALLTSLSVRNFHFWPGSADSSRAKEFQSSTSAGFTDGGGVKISWDFPDNRNEPTGAVFKLEHLSLIVTDRMESIDRLAKEELPGPVIVCLNYEQFTGSQIAKNFNSTPEKIIITGWDFRTGRTVEQNLMLTFPEDSWLWTKNTGAVEIEVENGISRYRTTLNLKN